MGKSPHVIASARLEEFFRSEVCTARKDLGVKMPDMIEYYLVNLLCDFSRRDLGPTPGEEPLVLMYKRASEASPEQRAQILKQMGDVALYVSGFFAEFVECSLVDLNYYISMGGHAYGNLSRLMAPHRHGDTFAELYGQLAVQFGELVDVLNEVSDRAKDTTDRDADLLRLYDRWVRTGSERTRRLLVDRGLVPAENLPTEYFQ